MKIALDVMGGDYGVGVNLEGLAAAYRDFPHIERFLLVGREAEIVAGLGKVGLKPNLPRLEIVHAEDVVEMHEKPAQAVRKKRKSSIGIAAALLRDGAADAIVSAGHTGATVASTVLTCRLLDGIERPGIASIMPGPKHPFMLLDAGANMECKPTHLAQYALLGEAYCRSLLGRPEPRLGLLNVGEEPGKGNELARAAYLLLERLPVNFVGNVDARGLYGDQADVLICDGFTGNIILKTSESLVGAMTGMLKDRLRQTPVRKAGAFLSQRAFEELRQMTDCQEYGGALLLGINGVGIIAHGSSTPKAIRNAIRVAAEAVTKRINEAVSAKMGRIDWQALQTPATAAAAPDNGI